MSTPAPAALLHAACHPYRAAGRFAYHFARAKLSADPAFCAILERGLLQGRQRVLDLGCGQGLLTAWLRAAEHCCRAGLWPAQWPPAPQGLTICGIELLARDVARARRALGAQANIIQGDIRSARFDSVDAVVILDVLHYLPAQEQRSVLQRVHRALAPAGPLLLRVADASAGPRFRYGQWIDKAVMLARGQGLAPLHYRSLAQWRALLSDCGFDSQAIPMSQGTPFANVLLSAFAR